MEEIINFTNYKLDESMTIEIEDSEEGVYVLTLHDIHNIVNKFTDDEVTEDVILDELTSYKFVKVDNPEIKEIDLEDSEVLFDPTDIKKFTEI
jgi:hypothetical protein